MTDLRTRLAKATEGSRELSDEMLRTLGWRPRVEGAWDAIWNDPNGRGYFPRGLPAPTRSLDAAVALIEAAEMRVECISWHKNIKQYIALIEDTVGGSYGSAHSSMILALCLALLSALEARAQMETTP